MTADDRIDTNENSFPLPRMEERYHMNSSNEQATGRVWLAGGRDRGIFRTKSADSVGDAGERDVVVKFVRLPVEDQHRAGRQRLLDEWKRECDALSKLKDVQGCVQLFDSGLATFKGEEWAYITTHFAGESLQRRLERGPVPSSREIADWMHASASAMARAHAKGVIHRDLKPGNILLDESGVVRICDFGSARVEAHEGAQELAATIPGIGTLGYMAPEQFVRGGRIGKRTDIYGLGAVLYHCLSGAPPYQGNNEQISHAVQRDKVPRIITFKLNDNDDHGLASGLEALSRSALRRWPLLRYQSMKSFVEAIRGFRNGGGSSSLSRLLDFVDDMFRWRDRVIYIGLGIAFLVAAVSAYIFQSLSTIERAASRGAVSSRIRLLQDASLDRTRYEDHGTAAVLVGLALKDASSIDSSSQQSIRTAASSARSRLLPLRHVFDTSGGAGKASGSRGCDISSDGQYAVIGTDRGQAWLVNLPSRSLLAVPYSTGDDPKADSISAVAFRPQSHQFAVATDDGVIHQVGVDSTGLHVGSAIKFGGQPLSLRYSEEGKYLVVAGRPKSGKGVDAAALAVYETGTGRLACRFPINHDLYAAAVSEVDGVIHIAAGGGTTPETRLVIWRWDPESENAEPVSVRTLPQPGRVFTVAFRPHHAGQLISGDANGVANLWDISRPAGEEFSGISFHHDKQIRVSNFSEDGELLLVGGEDGTARLWNVDSARRLGQRLEHCGQVRAGAVSSKAGWVVTSDFAGHVRLWELGASQLHRRGFSHPGPVWDAAFDESGEKIFSACPASVDASGVFAAGAGRVWDLQSGGMVHLPHGADVMSINSRPGHADQVFTFGNDGTVKVWQRDTGKSIPTDLSYDKVILTSVFDGKGDFLAYAGQNGKVVAVRLKGASPDAVEKVIFDQPTFSWVWNVRFSADGKFLFSDGGNAVVAWDWMERKQAFTFDPRPTSARQDIDNKVELRIAALDHGKKRIVVTGMDGSAWIWSFDSKSMSSVRLVDQKAPIGRAEQPHGTGQIFAATRAQDETIATGGPDGVVRVWQRRGQEHVATQLYHPSAIDVLVFSPDGKWLACGCRDGSVRIWDADTFSSAGIGWFHVGPVTQLRFSKNGQRVLSAGRDGMIFVEPIYGPMSGDPTVIHNTLETESGITMGLVPGETTASYAAPRPLLPTEFDKRSSSR